MAAIVSPGVHGLYLALAEIHQQQGRPREALDNLKQLHRHYSDDVVVRLSLAELLIAEGGSKRNCKSVVRLAQGIENDSEIHGALLLYKAIALRQLGLSCCVMPQFRARRTYRRVRPVDRFRIVCTSAMGQVSGDFTC